MKKTISLMLFLFFTLSGFAVSAEDNLYVEFGLIKPEEIKSAPSFSLKNLNGKEMTLDDFKNKVVIINFWATWCKPCIREMPSMEKLYTAFKDKGFAIVAISIDKGGVEGVKSFIKEHNLTFPVLLDPGQETRKKYHVTGLPASYLINSKGQMIRYAIGGREWDSDVAIKIVKSLVQ